MKIVIDISADVYTRLFDNGIQDNEIAVDDVCEMARAIRLGTPLPKGHGRLIDSDNLDVISYQHTSDDFDNGVKWLAEQIDNAPTIIEADKEYEAKVITRGNCMICGRKLTDGLFLCKECGEKANKAESEDKESEEEE